VVLGRAYFAEANYKQAANWLSKSVQNRPNVLFNRAQLISAYALTDRTKEATAALAAFKACFQPILWRGSLKSTQMTANTITRRCGWRPSI
jgi:hypothetical protein